MSYHRPRWEAVQRDGMFYIERMMSAGPHRPVATVTSVDNVRDAAYIVHAPPVLEAFETLVMHLHGLLGRLDPERPSSLSAAMQREMRRWTEEAIRVISATNMAMRGEGPSVRNPDEPGVDEARGMVIAPKRIM